MAKRASLVTPGPDRTNPFATHSDRSFDACPPIHFMLHDFTPSLPLRGRAFGTDDLQRTSEHGRGALCVSQLRAHSPYTYIDLQESKPRADAKARAQWKWASLSYTTTLYLLVPAGLPKHTFNVCPRFPPCTYVHVGTAGSEGGGGTARHWGGGRAGGSGGDHAFGHKLDEGRADPVGSIILLTVV